MFLVKIRSEEVGDEITQGRKTWDRVLRIKAVWRVTAWNPLIVVLSNKKEKGREILELKF